MRLPKAQLFWDVNKRTAQLVANRLMIEGGFGVFSVPVNLIAEFNRLSVEYYDGTEPDGLESYLLSNCIKAIDFDS